MGKFPGPLRPYNNPPLSPQLDAGTQHTLNWLVSTVNALVNQQLQQGTGLNQVPGTIDPTGTRIQSKGSLPQSIVTKMSYLAGTNYLSIYWDGTNGSDEFRIYRSDGTVTTPTSGNVKIGALTSGTLYYVYMYYDEVLNQVGYIIDQTNGVGSPKAAFTGPSITAAHLCILSSRMPLALTLANTGITLPSSGTITGSAGSGGGGSGGRGYAL